jgi:Uma2 family endonuclease
MAFADTEHPDTDLPDLDDRLVEPGTRFEMLDGELIQVSPADEPHGPLHNQIGALIELHAGLDFEIATDLLTRTSKVDDIAPDVSVYPRARHPLTGRRQLLQLAFEIVSTQTLSHAGRKATKLASRGVRRVFAIDVERERALEWSADLGTWSVLDSESFIDDEVFDTPLPIKSLIRTACIDDDVARALLAKGNEVLEAHAVTREENGKQLGLLEGKQLGLLEGKQLGLLEGKQLGLLEAVWSVVEARGLPVQEGQRARILGERDIERITRWLARAATATTIDDVLGDD